MGLDRIGFDGLGSGLRLGLDWIGKLTRQRHIDMHEANVGADARWELLA